MKFSVLMSVYKNDDPEYLKIALESIYDQQTRKPDEVIVVFDGPLNDRLYAVLDEFKKGRREVVKYCPQEVKRGLGEALRIGSELCTGDYILLMTSKDISSKERFAKQIAYIETHPEVDGLGGNIAEFNEDPFKEATHVCVHPTVHESIVKLAKKRNPINHVTACIKKSALIKAGGYQPLLFLEDYLLWLNMIVAGCRLANINETLAYVRADKSFDKKGGSKDLILGWSLLQDKMIEHGMITSREKDLNMMYIKMLINSFAESKENHIRKTPQERDTSVSVSIILPCYNCGELLLDTVSSIVDQSYKNWELLIVDDCSNDAITRDVLLGIASVNQRIRVLSTNINSGAGVARNVGLDNAHNKYIAFCDADDWWYPQKLEKQMRFMLNNGYRFVCSYYEDCDAKLNIRSVVRQKPRQSFSDLISGCNIGSPGVVYCKNGVEDIRFPDARRGEDWRMWLRLLSRIDYIYSYPEPLWKYRHIEGSTNSSKYKIVSSVIDLYREELHYSYLRSYLFFFFVFIPRYFWRKVFGK